MITTTYNPAHHTTAVSLINQAKSITKKSQSGELPMDQMTIFDDQIEALLEDPTIDENEVLRSVVKVLFTQYETTQQTAEPWLVLVYDFVSIVETINRLVIKYRENLEDPEFIELATIANDKFVSIQTQLGISEVDMTTLGGIYNVVAWPILMRKMED